MEKKNYLLAAVALSMLISVQPVSAVDIDSFSDITGGIPANNSFTFTQDISDITTNKVHGFYYPVQSGFTATLDGQKFNFIGTQDAIISIEDYVTLNVNNIGDIDNPALNSGITGFNVVSGKLIGPNSNGDNVGGLYNNSILNINNSVISNNTSANSTSGEGYGGILTNFEGTATINNSVFISNQAGSGDGTGMGGAIYNGNGYSNREKPTLTIKDTSFYANTASTRGGAIYNQDGTVNIVSENKDVVFTGNTANGNSNALYNENIVNLDAKSSEHNIVFNDRISGSGNNTININANGGTGTVEFNNYVQNADINLNAGTLKLGTHEYEEDVWGVNVAKTSGSLAPDTTLIANGGALSLQDGTIKTTNLGNLDLTNSDLNVAIDAALQGTPSSDMMTATSVKGSNNVIINAVNILSDADSKIVKTQVADSNLMGVVELDDNAAITKPSNISYTLAYNNQDGYLTYNSTYDLKQAVANTDSSRVYNMAEDEAVTGSIGTMGGEGASLVINAGGYNIKGDGTGNGIRVENNNGKPNVLTINNVGQAASDGHDNIENTGFTGFTTSEQYTGTVVSNFGVTNINESTFSNNVQGAMNTGGVIYNSGTLKIDDSNFVDRSTVHDYILSGGSVIYNYGGEVEITDSYFGNNTGNTGVINNTQGGTTTIKNSIFEDNKSFAGTPINNSSGTVNIIDTQFIGTNTTDPDYGTGHAVASTSTLNIKAENSDTVFEAGNSLYTKGTMTVETVGDNSVILKDDLTNGGTITVKGDNFVIGSADKAVTIKNDNQAGVITAGTITGDAVNIAGQVTNENVISAAINIQQGGNLISEAEKLTGTVTNLGNSALSGALDKEILGTGTTKIDGTLIFEDGAKVAGVLDLNSGVLDIQNNSGTDPHTITSHDVGHIVGDGTIKIDADMSNLSADKLNITDGTSNNANITIDKVNVTQEYSDANYQENLAVISGTTSGINYSVKDDSTVTLTSDNRYEFAAGTDGNLTVKIDKTTNSLSEYITGQKTANNYSLTKDENLFEGESIGTTSGTQTNLSVNMNGNNINNGLTDKKDGITVAAGDKLTVDGGSGSVNNFGTAFTNNGELNLKDINFSGNDVDVANSSTLNLSGTNKIAAGITGTDGTTNILDGETTFVNAVENKLNVESGAVINAFATDFKNTVNSDGTMNLSGGVIGNAVTGTGTTNISGYVENNAAVEQGKVVIASGAGLVTHADVVAVIDNAGTLSSSADNIKGTVNNTGDYNVLGGTVSQSVTGSGNLNIEESSVIDTSVTGNNIKLDAGILSLTQNADIANANSFVANGGTLSLQNGAIQNTNLGNLTLNQDLDLMLDGNFAQNQIDTITANSFNANGNSINIADILITEPTKATSFSISPIGSGMDEAVRTALAGAIQYTGGDITYSPIFKYSAAYDPMNGMFNFTRVGGGSGYSSYNPDVFAAPVAAQLGGYLVQLNSYDNAFRNMDMYMLMTKEQRQAMKLRNKYAAGDDSALVYDPTVSQYENRAGWFRPYATFESVPLKNGPDVSNVAYGTFIGTDSELYDLGHGWDGMLSVYAGYNGSHQAYDGVGIWQNGGTLGVVGMAYKDNFFTGLTANVGASVGDANTMFGTDDFTMLMSGIASKTGYNYELADGKFIIQPSMLMSYSFINTFDFTNSAGTRIDSDPLHAIHLEPGLKFIGNLQNGWQPYAGVSVVWNIMDRTQFKANDVSLPNLSVDPFVKYGVGLRKAWGERFTGFLQAFFTQGGRKGVGLQAGFRWVLGKNEEPKTQKAQAKFPQKEATKISLNNIK